MTYSVKEIYYTIQGEGHHTGRAAIFCRFSGCNLWSGKEVDRKKASCNFCDTDFIGTNGQGGGKFNTSKELVKNIISYWPVKTRPFVVLTGGEPMLQVDSNLIRELKTHNFEIAIETNGTLRVPRDIDWICVSPKSGTKLNQLSGDEIKIVYPQVGLDPKKYEGLKFKYFSLQPLDNKNKTKNINNTIKYCSKNPKWRVSLQTHKITGIK
ncbi:MAG: 7-carboxy-7-deazaguanine synthase [Rickettsiales bacterium]|nr:7-carboxy-7-deazaguanine synthase [Rickettsiales bacterium]|tara:strand:+ start:558 stop:1187 length:630 start_codon:yes stop_codon:yes gene_type:complete